MDQILHPHRVPEVMSRLDICDPVNWLPVNTSELIGCTWKSRPPIDICSKTQMLVVYPSLYGCLWIIKLTCAKLEMAERFRMFKLEMKSPGESFPKDVRRNFG